MRSYSFFILILIGLLSSTCSLTNTPLPPTRTPRPTITATFAATEVPSPTELSTDPPNLSATVGGPGSTQTVTPTSTSVQLNTPTPTRRPVIVRPTLAPLTISNILLIKVDRDPTRENGAIASLQVVYSGGRAPYTIFHDDTLQPNNPFQVLTVCQGTLVHTLRVTSGDKQAITKQYYLSPIDCPP